MLSRREYLKNSALLGTACALPAGVLRAFERDDLITRAIPKTGEQIPIVGLGSSATFRRVAQSEDVSALSDVINNPRRERALELLSGSGRIGFATATSRNIDFGRPEYLVRKSRFTGYLSGDLFRGAV